MAALAKQARQAAATQRWEGFPENMKVKLRELDEAMGYMGSLEKVQGWWAQNKASLVALGITADAQLGKDGWTALHCASHAGHEDIVRYLVDVQGSDVNLTTAMDGASPLMLAASENEAACLRALLELGADPTLRNDEGQTALDCAREQCWTECVAILEQWVPIPTVKSALKG